jgi:hypothetical protein
MTSTASSAPRARWSTADVLALAPDRAVAHAARGLAVPATWSNLGSDEAGVWGLYRGTSAEPYEVMVDRTGPAWRCSCPSRKVPCKHALGLLLLWAEGNVPTTVRPERAAAWLAARAAAALAAGPAPAAGDAGVSENVPPGDRRPVVEPAPAPDRAREKRADERAARVRAGLDELDRWLADQVRRGLVAPESTSRSAWEGAASRLVDAQAGALANRVRRATELLDVGPSGLGAVLGELATLHALAVAGRRPGALDTDLATSVRTAVGWTVSREEVLSGTPVTDRWHVVGRSDTEEHRITVRRTWLLGERTGRWGLLLDFAAFGQTLAEDPAVGMVLHADLHHFPGRVPIRALVGVEHDPAEHDVEGPPASTVAGTLADAGWAIAREPWLERWPGVVRATPAVRSTGRGWALVDETGALALTDDRAIATLLAVSGGHPVVVAGEHRTAGFAPLAVRVRDRTAALR